MNYDEDLTALAEAVGVLHHPAHDWKEAIAGGIIATAITAAAWATVSTTTYLLGGA